MTNFSPGPGNPEATRESQEQQGKTLESKGTIPNIERITQTLIEIHGGLQLFLSRLENYPDLKGEVENTLKEIENTLKIIEILNRLSTERDSISQEELKIFTEKLPQLISRLREILNNLKRLNLKEYIIIAPETYVNLIDVLINKIEENLAELEKNIPGRGGWTRRRVVGLLGVFGLLTALGYLFKKMIKISPQTPPPTETPTPTIPPTATPEPTATATPEPTATATATLEPTPNIFEIIEEESVNFANKLRKTLLKSSESFKNNEPFFAKVLELLANDEEFLEIIKELYKRLRFSGFELTETWEPFVDSESFLMSIIHFKNPYPLELEINKEILDKELNKLGPNQSRVDKLELDVTYWSLFIVYPSFWVYEAKLSFVLGCSRCDAKTSNGKLTYFLEKTGRLYLNVSIRKEAQKSLKPDGISYLIRETIKRIVKSLPKPPKNETQNGKQNE